jgi:geranylgeranyl diphosphate synthase type I
VTWADLRRRARERPESLSPWAADQIDQLGARKSSLVTWLERAGAGTALDRCPDDGGARPAGPDGGVLDPLRAAVDRVLAEFLAARESELLAVDPSLAPVASEIQDLVAAGGKRLRPAFVVWGHRAAGGRDVDAALGAGAAVELLHAFALVHDDVMDRAATRRGRPAASRSFARLHERERWSGDAAWFGTGAAILAGDLAFVWADQLLDGSVPPAALARARRAFTTLRAEVMAGQYLDLRFAAGRDTGEDDARRVALLKSGRYTVTRPLQLGLALATGDPPAQVARALMTYGDAVGTAFQLRDDVLGLFGDPARTGKGRDDDLREGKRTLLVLRALSLAPAADRRFLSAALGDAGLTGSAGARCREIVADSGALASVETSIRAHHAVALDALGALEPTVRLALAELADVAIRRSC